MRLAMISGTKRRMTSVQRACSFTVPSASTAGRPRSEELLEDAVMSLTDCETNEAIDARLPAAAPDASLAIEPRRAAAPVSDSTMRLADWLRAMSSLVTAGPTSGATLAKLSFDGRLPRRAIDCDEKPDAASLERKRKLTIGR